MEAACFGNRLAPGIRGLDAGPGGFVRVWDRTHRIGGWMFIAIGIVLAIGVLLPVTVSTALTASTAGSLVVALTIYSFFIWRGDPDKVPPAGTQPG